MPMSTDELGLVVAELLAIRKRDKPRLDTIAAWMANAVSDVYVPKSATREYRMLVAQARFNVLPLVVATVAQALFVDGYRPTGPSGRAPSVENAAIWDAVWQPNRMDARQAALYRPAITYGYSYALVLPGEPAPVITPYGPQRLVAHYDDPVNDEWPAHAMVCHGPDGGGKDPWAGQNIGDGARITVYDDAFSYDMVKTGGSWSLAEDGVGEHGLGVVPVVRFLDEISDQMSKGKIEPLLPAQRQLNQTTFGLLMAQQYAAFRQRWVTGMAIAEDAEGNPVEPFNAAVNRLWQAEKADTKFGEFSQTDLDGYLTSRDKTLLFIASVAQIPPHNLIIGGGISNISAEALVALEQGHRMDVSEHQTSFGESIEQMLRLAGRAMGDTVAWEDTSAQVVWRDTTPRSLAQVADALGKLATQLGVPARALWERIPDVTDQDIARWEAMGSDQDLLSELSSMTTGGGAETVAGGGPAAADAADIKAKADALGALIRAGVSPAVAAARVGLPGLEFTGAVPVSLRLPETQAADLEQS
jgi:hypothetical protein